MTCLCSGPISCGVIIPGLRERSFEQGRLTEVTDCSGVMVIDDHFEQR